jgi:hypothetical protein
MHLSPCMHTRNAWRTRSIHTRTHTHTHTTRCCEAGQSEQAVGVALESRRLDKLEEVISRSADTTATLKYALTVCQNLVTNREFRQQVRACVRVCVCVCEAAVA